MGRDNHPKARHRWRVERKINCRESYDRILIVSEGSKTEPLYFKEIQREFRLHTANVQVQPSEWGTDPRSVVKYAIHLFINGDKHKRIQARAFEKVFAVFDRDDHLTYFEALELAKSTNGCLQNDARKRIEFHAVPSVPCFELWLLLHYDDVHHLLHRNEVIHRLKSYIPDYQKGNKGIYTITKCNLENAYTRAQGLCDQNNPYDGTNPYTNIHELVELLTKLKLPSS